MIKEYVFTILATLLFTQAGIAQSTGTFTDPRDGQTYKTFSFKNALTGTTVSWMAQNLNYKVQGSYAYDDKESNREELGLLYTWEAAKKACPKGWHLATDSEWSTLVTQFGGTDKAGEALKSVSGWIENGNGTNSSGFNALPAGIRRNNGYEVWARWVSGGHPHPRVRRVKPGDGTSVMVAPGKNHLKRKRSVSMALFLTQNLFVASGIDYLIYHAAGTRSGIVGVKSDSSQRTGSRAGGRLVQGGAKGYRPERATRPIPRCNLRRSAALKDERRLAVNKRGFIG